MEGVILRFIPSINQLKLMANDTLHLEDAQVAWKPVLLLHEQKYSAAFVVEENDELITLFVSKGVSLKEGEILTRHKREVTLQAVAYTTLFNCSKALEGVIYP